MFALLFKLSLWSLVASSPTIKQIKDKIVGGEEIDIKEAPYQVVINLYGSLHCSGSIVDHDIILTGAGCSFDIPDPTQYTIRAGSSNMSEGGQLVQISSIRANSNYTNAHLDYDVGIMRLATPLIYSDVIKPIKMADVCDDVPDGADVVVTGWGKTTQNGSLSAILRRVVVHKVNHAECNEAYESKVNQTITTRMICAGVPEGGKGVCVGDGGAPLVYNNKLVGLVSFGLGCAQPGFPGVYSNVAALRTWIDENIKLMRQNDSKKN